MKKIISLLLTICLLAGLGCTFAIDEGEARAVIGANLTPSQKQTVYETFGIKQGDVEEITVTNAEERQYLDGLVDESIIGTNAISCVYIEILGEGDGLEVETSNINWCSKEMYVNALVTAGIEDAKVNVTSPIAGISGTAALTGIYKAYEQITGKQLDATAKLAGTQELVTTAELADTIGNYDAVAIVNELKLILDETKDMTDDELKSEIRSIADQYNVEVTDGQINQLIKLSRSLEGLDEEGLKAKVESIKGMVSKMAEAQEKVSGFAKKVQGFFQKVGDFISDIFGNI